MIRDDFDTELPHEPVKKIGGAALKSGIGSPVFADPVDDFASIEICAHKERNRARRVLEIGVHGDERFRFIAHRHQTGEERALMPDVSGKFNAAIEGAAAQPGLDFFPGAVATSVVDETDEAADLNFFGFDQITKLGSDGLGGCVERVVFIEAGNDDSDSGRRHDSFDLRFVMLENQAEKRVPPIFSRISFGFSAFGVVFFVYVAFLTLIYGIGKLSLATGCHWDCGWYQSIIRNGYVSVLPPTVQDADHSNVAFFPLFPLFGGLAARLFGIPSESALPLVSIFFAVGICGMLPFFASRKKIALLLAYPATFYFFVAYSESVYCFFLFAGLLFLFRRRQLGPALSLAGVFLAGVALGLTRLTGFLIPGALLGLFSLGFLSGRLKFDRLLFALLAVWGVGALLGGGAFFAYIHAKFGVWNLYFQTLNVGWHKEVSFSGFVRYFFRAILKNVFPPYFARDPIRMSWLVNADLLIVFVYCIFIESREIFRITKDRLTSDRFLRFGLLLGGLGHLLVTTLGDSGEFHRWMNGMRYSMPMFYLIVFLWDSAWTPAWLAARPPFQGILGYALFAFWIPYQLYYLYLFTQAYWVS